MVCGHYRNELWCATSLMTLKSINSSRESYCQIWLLCFRSTLIPACITVYIHFRLFVWFDGSLMSIWTKRCVYRRPSCRILITLSTLNESKENQSNYLKMVDQWFKRRRYSTLSRTGLFYDLPVVCGSSVRAQPNNLTEVGALSYKRTSSDH